MSRLSELLERVMAYLPSEYELEKYYKLDSQEANPTYFVRFTDIDKVGINPMNSYSNIYGVYAWLIRTIMKDIRKGRTSFAGSLEYAHVLKVRPSCKVLDNTTYTQSDYNDDISKLRTYYEKNQNRFSLSEIESDRWLGSIFSPYIKNPSFDSLTKVLPDWYRRALSGTVRRGKNKLAQDIYFLSGLLSWLIISDNQHSRVIKWNSIIRYLGYELICDRGPGFLWAGEGAQAVFLSAKGYELIATLKNSNYKSDNLEDK